MKYFAIYKIHCVATNKDYIGLSNNPEGRVNAHENSPYPIGCAIRKYGWENFDVDILYLVKTREEANKLEIKEIAKHNCIAPNGYNLTEGGSTGSPCEETRKKRSNSLKGRSFPHLVGENNFWFGKKRPDVVKRNKKGKGRKCPQQSKRMKENNPAKRPEVRKKLKDSMKGNKHLEGHKHSEKTKTKMAIARLKYWIAKLESK